MKGYIYTMFNGADPGRGWHMTDPIFGELPTLGACMPNIRRVVTQGDHIFVVSGRIEGARQYVVGGFQVDRKIHALEAFRMFPANRCRRLADGRPAGNVIVDQNGEQSNADYHTNFERRVENYIIGKDPIVLDSFPEIERARAETVPILSEIFQKNGGTPGQIIGRFRRLNEEQILRLIDWMAGVKKPLEGLA